MDKNLVYVKTPIGDEAVRQSAHVVKRNLRMVLVQVDGKLSVAEMSSKIGNRQLVESALRELEAEGFIAPTLQAVSVWEEGVRKAQATTNAPPPLSAFSAFDPGQERQAEAGYSRAMAGNFSRFGQSNQTKIPATESAPKFISPVIAEKREFKKERKPLPWGKLIFIALIGSIFLGLATLVYYPYDNFRARLETSASQYLKVPVHISSVQLVFLPKPSFLLSGVSLGSQGDASIETISLPPLALIGSGVPEIQRMEISGATISLDRLHDFSFLSSLASDTKPALVLGKIVINRLSLKAGALKLDDLNGELQLGGGGLLEKAEIQAVDRSIRMVATPSPAGLVLNIEGFGWKPYAGSSIAFESLQAKGLLQSGKLLIQNFDSTLLGGVIKGSWFLDWSQDLVMAGDATLARLDAKRTCAALAPKLALEGEIAGVIRLRGSGIDAASLWRNSESGIDLVMKNGILHGVDLGEAVRRGAGSSVRGGATKFDRLSGNLTIASSQLVGRAIQLDAGKVVANGQFSSSGENRIEANMVVTMNTAVSTLRSSVRVSGMLPDLLTVANR